MATVKISLSFVSLSPSSSSSTQSKLSPSFIPNAAPSPAKLRFNGKCLRAKPMVHRASRSGGITCSATSSPTSTLPSALLFDCDGVLVDTEKDGHRISFNDTFKEVSFSVFCSP